MQDKKVFFVSCGGGRRSSLTRRALKTLAAADVWIGPKELLAVMGDPASGKALPACVPAGDMEDVEKAVRQSRGQKVAVLCRGDAGGSAHICACARRLAAFHPVILPGIPALSEFSARTGISYEGMPVLDLTDGRGSLLLELMRNQRVLACMGEYAPMYLGELEKAGLGDLAVCRMAAADSGREMIEYGRLKELKAGRTASAIYYLQRKTPPAFPTMGISDDLFERGEIPMTKREVRIQALAALNLTSGDTVWDVGAGTGSVTVEAAMQVQRGLVFAIEKNMKGAVLIKHNVSKYGLHNVRIIPGEAPAALEGLPDPDVVFIGGSGGHFRDIFQIALSRNPHVRMGATAISLETVSEAVEEMELYHMDPQVTQISVSRSRKAGRVHMMTALNPVFVVWGQKKRGEDGGVG